MVGAREMEGDTAVVGATSAEIHAETTQPYTVHCSRVL